MRTIAIGDIHGCLKALEGLLSAIGPTPDDRLVFLGDYVDRGPDSRGVIERLLALQKETQTVFLLGNHEIMFRTMLARPVAQAWLDIGGQATLESYEGAISNVPRSHAEFLFSLLPYFETEDAIFAHANFDPQVPMCEQTEDKLYWEHLDEAPLVHCSGKHVYLGHTPQPEGRIGQWESCTCIDTYCFGGGWLTGLDVNSGMVWQVSQDGQLRVETPRGGHGLWRKLDKFFARRSAQSSDESAQSSSS